MGALHVFPAFAPVNFQSQSKMVLTSSPQNLQARRLVRLHTKPLKPPGSWKGVQVMGHRTANRPPIEAWLGSPSTWKPRAGHSVTLTDPPYALATATAT